MKDQTSVIITAIAIAYLAVRIYQKYIKKDKGQQKTTKKDNTFSSSPGEDEYDPYSKK